MRASLLLVVLFLAAFPRVAECSLAPTAFLQESGTVRPLSIVACVGYVETIRNVTFFTVKGVVQNNSTSNVRSVNVTATFYRGGDEVMSTRTVRALQDIVEPQGKTPFEIYMPLRSSVPDDYGLVAEGVETDEIAFASIEIQNLARWVDNGSFCRIVGEVHNNGWMIAKSVRVMCAFYAPNSDLVTIAGDVVDPLSVVPGGKADFELSSAPFSSPVGDFELFIVVHHYERPALANWILFTVLIAVSLVFLAYMRRRGW